MYGPSPVPTLAQLRTQIGDNPQLCCKQGAYEMLASPGDGTTMSFPLRFMNAILPSVTVFSATLPSPADGSLPVYAPIDPDDPAYGWTVAPDANGIPTLTFDLIAPDTSTLVGVRYLVTAFTDAQLTTWLSDETNILDTLTLSLMRLHYVIIPAILANRDASMVYRIQDRSDDPSQWSRGLLQIRAQLKIDLDELGEGDDPTGGSISYMGGGYAGLFPGGQQSTPYINGL